MALDTELPPPVELEHVLGPGLMQAVAGDAVEGLAGTRVYDPLAYGVGDAVLGLMAFGTETDDVRLEIMYLAGMHRLVAVEALLLLVDEFQGLLHDLYLLSDFAVAVEADP